MKYLRTFSKHAWVWAASIPVTVVVAVLLSLWLVGCSEYDYAWIKRHETMENIRVVRVPDVDAVCRRYAVSDAERMIGCARRDYAAGVCTIYLPLHYPQWLLEHERRHCLTGEDHA